MSTRSNIFVKLQPETRGTQLKLNLDLLPGKTQDNGYEYPIPDVDVPEDANYMGIYHHWDGYLSGVGATLLKYYNTYEKVVNLLMMGDLSCIVNSGETPRLPDSYRGNGNKEVPPRFRYGKTLSTIRALHHSYAYLFRNGKWWFTTWDDDSKPIKWRRLTKKAIKLDL